MEWRLIVDGPYSGDYNMAMDESIARSVGEGKNPPTLRIYHWDPPCVSLGYFQRYEEVNLEECRKRCFDIVRRPTGGRAVLHHKEVTYSISMPAPSVPQSILKSYLYLSDGLLEAFRIMGLEPRLSSASSKGGSSLACFDAPSTYELLINGKKTVGSAQVRNWGALLQHGSVPLNFEPREVAAVMSSGEKAARLAGILEKKAGGLFDILGYEIGLKQVEGAIISGFEKALNIKFRLETPSEQELSVCQELVADKYGNPAWTQFRQIKEGNNCSISS